MNTVPFDEQPNTRIFFRGEKPNWGLISRRIAFKRDIESTIYEDVLDYVTSSAKGPHALAALGPGGYGTTTLLMHIAARAAEDRLGNIFILRDGQVPSEGDVEFAAALDPTLMPIFIVDTAFRFTEELRSCMQRLRNLNLPALFLLGSRLNQWHMTTRRPNATEHIIEPLSDEEINKVIDCLAATNELGVLTNVPRDLQFGTIKMKYQQELLVVLREATEGRAFDGIIVDEYRAIKPDEAKRAYLIVSCFYQAGTYIRDSLLAELLGLDIGVMYQTIAVPTEGIIRFDEIDAATGAHGARARHRTIAAIVWQNCGTPGEREAIAMHALEALNLNYQTDVDAFWELVQTPMFVDDFRNLDEKIRFFETACQKDPSSPYVRQHYARMFLRNNQLTFALKEIDAAIELNGDAKALHHTRGLILSDLMMQAPTEDVARRRLLQSEEAFNRCIALDRRDDYGYKGLAEVDLRWAKKTRDEAEENEYLARAELATSEGLKFARAKEQLWITSSEIERYLGDEPKRIEALEAALGSVASSRVGRYFLGRYYRSKGRSEDALAVMKPAIDNFQDDYKLFIEYALAMIDADEQYAKAAAVLRIANITGMRDARYIALLGGLLFMSGDMTEAAKVFEATSDRNFAFEEETKPYFIPRKEAGSSSHLRLTGFVSRVKPGYAFIDSGGKSFFHYGTKIGSLILKIGLSVDFTPGFTARGARALEVTEAKSVAVQQSILGIR